MRIALCNEVLAGMPLQQQCEHAARLGYDGLEIAPFTLSASPEKISATDAARVRAIVEASGLVVTGLHWLLVKPDGLSLTDPDPGVRNRTLEVMIHLIGLCASEVRFDELIAAALPHRIGQAGRVHRGRRTPHVQPGVPRPRPHHVHPPGLDGGPHAGARRRSRHSSR